MNSSNDKARILIVDDTVQNLQVVANILRPEGYSLSLAKNGQQALDAIKEGNFDLVLLDLMMPVMNGFECLEAMRGMEEAQGLPVIVVTALAEITSVVKGFELGAVDYVTKPFQTQELLARVKTHLQIRLQSKQVEQKSKDLRSLLKVLCHDLDNPLAAAEGFLELVESFDDYERYKDKIRQNLTTTRKIIGMIREIQAFEEGRTHLDLRRENLREMVTEALELSRHRLQKKELTARLELDDQLFIQTERTSFVNTVLANLINNAIKFSYPGARLEFSAEELMDKVLLKLRDFGVGMGPSALADFYSITGPQSRLGTAGERGTGFGIPLVKRFVQAFGGEIRVRSWEEAEDNNPAGTEITLVLPKC